MQGSCRSRLHIRCAAEVKTNDAKQAGAAANGTADKEPEYYEVDICPCSGSLKTACAHLPRPLKLMFPHLCVCR